uniref:Uncharacterized protein n=1 Tax=Angiostrongylus cantonensis TaxID=6313 RepID=A0A0K0DPP1_ANGCA
MDTQLTREDNSTELSITRCCVHQKKFDIKEPGVEKMLNKNSEPEKLKEMDDPAFSRRRKQSFRDKPLKAKRDDNGSKCKKKRERRVRWADQPTSHPSLVLVLLLKFEWQLRRWAMIKYFRRMLRRKGRVVGAPGPRRSLRDREQHLLRLANISVMNRAT